MKYSDIPKRFTWAWVLILMVLTTMLPPPVGGLHQFLSIGLLPLNHWMQKGGYGIDHGKLYYKSACV